MLLTISAWKVFGFLGIPNTNMLNKQSKGQLSRGQFNLNPPNMLSHTSSDCYPSKRLNGSLSTMYNQRVTKLFGGDNTSSTQSPKHQSFKDNNPKWIATWQFYEIVMQFFMEHIMEYLNGVFVKQGIGLEKYKEIMENQCLE